MKKISIEEAAGIDRRSFLTRASLLGGAALLPFAGLARAAGQNWDANDRDNSRLAEGDRSIIIVAEIAEALAVTTYMNIINTSPFFSTLPGDDQTYLAAALQEEMSHYLLEESVTGQPTPFTKFFYPAAMFTDPQPPWISW